MVKGFDASAHTGPIDHAAAYAAGWRFMWGRVGRGKPDSSTDSSGIDRTWDGGSGARAAGVMPGGYWRFYPNVSMTDQVGKFARALAQRPGMLPPLLDIEDNPGDLSPKALTDWTIACADEIRAKTGSRPVIYTGENFYDTALQSHRLDRWQICLANWSAKTWPDASATFWQYRGDVTNVGWAGDVDLIQYVGTLDELTSLGNDHDLLYVISKGWLYGPRCDHRPLPEAESQAVQPNHSMILHSMSGYLAGTDALFRNSANTESHFGIGGDKDKTASHDGAVWQWMDLARRADASLEGNAYAASIETSDGAPADEEPGPRWSGHQAESIAQVIAAWCRTYGRPAAVIDRARSTERGVGYHRLGIDPWRKAGDDKWSTARGKTCPMDARIAQLRGEVVPRAAAILASVTAAPTPPPMEDDVPKWANLYTAADQVIPAGGTRILAWNVENDPSGLHADDGASVRVDAKSRCLFEFRGRLTAAPFSDGTAAPLAVWVGFHPADWVKQPDGTYDFVMRDGPPLGRVEWLGEPGEPVFRNHLHSMTVNEPHNYVTVSVENRGTTDVTLAPNAEFYATLWHF